jgi:hypothetical protein
MSLMKDRLVFLECSSYSRDRVEMQNPQRNNVMLSNLTPEDGIIYVFIGPVNYFSCDTSK